MDVLGTFLNISGNKIDILLNYEDSIYYQVYEIITNTINNNYLKFNILYGTRQLNRRNTCNDLKIVDTNPTFTIVISDKQLIYIISCKDKIMIFDPESGVLLDIINETYLFRDDNIIFTRVVIQDTFQYLVKGINITNHRIIFSLKCNLDASISLSLDKSIISIVDRDNNEFKIYKIINDEKEYLHSIDFDDCLLINVVFTEKEMISVTIVDIFDDYAEVVVYNIDDFTILNIYRIIGMNTRIFSPNNEHFIDINILGYKIYESTTGKILFESQHNTGLINIMNVVDNFIWFPDKMIILFCLNSNDEYHVCEILKNTIKIVTIVCDNICLYGKDYVCKVLGNKNYIYDSDEWLQHILENGDDNNVSYISIISTM